MRRHARVWGTMKSEMPRTILVVMGVSGCGKSTIAAQLADMLGWPVEEGDRLHPRRNIEKMSQGVPLDDDDRQPWLQAVAGKIDQWREKGAAGIITCSALKRAYRDQLASQRPDVLFVFLKGSKELIRARLAKRSGHFMPPDLLDSQFAALEEPVTNEHAITVSIEQQPAVIADAILADLKHRTRH